jgi:hypothetical protein
VVAQAGILRGNTAYDPPTIRSSTAARRQWRGRIAWGSDAWPLAVRLAPQRLADAA